MCPHSRKQVDLHQRNDMIETDQGLRYLPNLVQELDILATTHLSVEIMLPVPRIDILFIRPNLFDEPIEIVVRHCIDNHEVCLTPGPLWHVGTSNPLDNF